MNFHLARRWPLLVLLVLASVTAAGWFQAPAPSPAEVPAPTVRVTTHMVVVDVVVTDKQGKPITGLHPEDFELEENGKTQKISTFVVIPSALAEISMVVYLLVIGVKIVKPEGHTLITA